MTTIRTEYGVICDATESGRGRFLVSTGTTPERAQRIAGTACQILDEHPHLLVKRTVTVSDWEDVQ